MSTRQQVDNELACDQGTSLFNKKVNLLKKTLLVIFILKYRAPSYAWC